MGSDPFPPSDTWLHSVLLVPASKPQIQTQTTDQQDWQSREILYMTYFHCRNIRIYVRQIVLLYFHSWSQLDGFQRHFDSQIITYGRQVILNLVCSSRFSPVYNLSALSCSSNYRTVFFFVCFVLHRLIRKVLRNLLSSPLPRWWRVSATAWSSECLVKDFIKEIKQP